MENPGGEEEEEDALEMVQACSDLYIIYTDINQLKLQLCVPLCIFLTGIGRVGKILRQLGNWFPSQVLVRKIEISSDIFISYQFF